MAINGIGTSAYQAIIQLAVSSEAQALCESFADSFHHRYLTLFLLTREVDHLVSTCFANSLDLCKSVITLPVFWWRVRDNL